MTRGMQRPPLAVTVVDAPGCHFCEDAEAVLSELSGQFGLEVSRVPIDSNEGRALTARHRPALSPLVLLDGQFFSSGRLPRKKLIRVLEGYGRRAPAQAVSPGVVTSDGL